MALKFECKPESVISHASKAPEIIVFILLRRSNVFCSLYSFSFQNSAHAPDDLEQVENNLHKLCSLALQSGWDKVSCDHISDENGILLNLPCTSTLTKICHPSNLCAVLYYCLIFAPLPFQFFFFWLVSARLLHRCCLFVQNFERQ